METEPSNGELLLATYHGRCGHRRQSGLPCATPGCKEGVGSMALHGIVREEVPFGDEIHYVWRRLKR